IAIITAAISTPMRNLSRPTSPQLGLLRLLFNLDMLNGGGHNCLDEVYYRFVTEFCIRKSDFSPGTLYSYGPWFTTSSVSPNPLAGGGEGSVHSSVVHSHGLAPAGLPLNILQKKLIRKSTWPEIVMMAATVINFCSGIMAATYWTPVSSENRRV